MVLFPRKVLSHSLNSYFPRLKLKTKNKLCFFSVFEKNIFIAALYMNSHFLSLLLVYLFTFLHGYFKHGKFEVPLNHNEFNWCLI